MRTRQLTQALWLFASIAALIACEYSLACSFVRAPEVAADGKRASIPAHQYMYRFWAEVLGADIVSLKTSRGEETISALRVRVVGSMTAKAAAGDVHQIRKSELQASCERRPVSLTLAEFPIGSTIQVTADQLSDAEVYRLEKP
jgi:hypothetical protein